MKNKKTKSINISVSEEVLSELEKRADVLGVNRSAYISMAIKEKFAAEDTAKNMPKVLTELSTISQFIVDYQKGNSEKLDFNFLENKK